MPPPAHGGGAYGAVRPRPIGLTQRYELARRCAAEEEQQLGGRLHVGHEGGAVKPSGPQAAPKGGEREEEPRLSGRQPRLAACLPRASRVGAATTAGAVSGRRSLERAAQRRRRRLRQTVGKGRRRRQARSVLVCLLHRGSARPHEPLHQRLGEFGGEEPVDRCGQRLALRTLVRRRHFEKANRGQRAEAADDHLHVGWLRPQRTPQRRGQGVCVCALAERWRWRHGVGDQ